MYLDWSATCIHYTWGVRKSAVWGPYHHPACIVWRRRCIIHLRRKAHDQKLRKTLTKKTKKKCNKTSKKRTAVFIAKKRNKYGKNGTVGISANTCDLLMFSFFVLGGNWSPEEEKYRGYLKRYSVYSIIIYCAYPSRLIPQQMDEEIREFPLSFRLGCGPWYCHKALCTGFPHSPYTILAQCFKPW